MKFKTPSIRAPRVRAPGRGSLASYVKDLNSWRAQYVIVGMVIFDFFINQLALSLSFYDDNAADSTKFAPANLDSKIFGWTVIRKLLFSFTISIRLLFVIESIMRLVHSSFWVFIKDVGNVCDAIIVFLALLSKLIMERCKVSSAVNQIMDERELLHKAEIAEIEAKWQQRQTKDKERYRIIKKKQDVAQAKLRVLMGEENVYNGEPDEEQSQLDEEESYNIEIPPQAQFSQSFSLTQIPPSQYGEEMAANITSKIHFLKLSKSKVLGLKVIVEDVYQVLGWFDQNRFAELIASLRISMQRILNPYNKTVLKSNSSLNGINHVQIIHSGLKIHYLKVTFECLIAGEIRFAYYLEPVDIRYHILYKERLIFIKKN
ncbi:hypothetical protein HK096_002306 [Nowakowskiella sp. JEL0078]|nr:hypothetical protein HK096_002306 [Nowakowskiella sp. JEL0078]